MAPCSRVCESNKGKDHMNKLMQRRRETRSGEDRSEIGILYVGETGYGPGTGLVRSPAKEFVDVLNRSKNGIALKTGQAISPGTAFKLVVYDKYRKDWEVLEGQTKWIEKADKFRLMNLIGAEIHPSEMDYQSLDETDDAEKCMPLAADCQFFRETELLSAIARDAVCPLLNCVAFRSVKAGQRFITQGEPGDAFYIIQKGTCAVNVEAVRELSTVARLRKGDIVGEMAILTGEPRSAHVDAECDMHLWRIARSDFDQISRNHPGLRNFLTNLLTKWFDRRTVTAQRKIAKYIITDIIGKGGYSIVYRGLHEALNRPVAIKMLKHDMAMETDFIRNFRNEAKTIANFNHPNIVRVYDIEERYRTLFIIMEHLEGMTLRKMLQKIIKLSPKKIVSYLLQVCAGLAYAHEHNLVHQDIKPGNIFIRTDGRVKILDFGLACPCGSENFLTGTPFYMSPEQIDCLPIDERSDIYGLGITAFEMVTGQRPFQDKDAWTVMDLHVSQDIPDPAFLVSDIPAGLTEFIRRACARDLNQRYQNITEVIAALNRLADELGLKQNNARLSDLNVTSLFLFYRDEHKHYLEKEMEEFCTKLRKMGITSEISED